MWREIRDPIRSVWRWRSGAALAILTLAVGIGASTSLYAFLRTALSTSGSFDDPALARIYESNPARPGERGALSADDAHAVALATSFESVAAYAVDDRVVTWGTETATVPV